MKIDDQQYTTELNPQLLIVDDEPKNLIAYQKILAQLELDIFEAQSGQQALVLAQKHDFFLILMDVQMPGMDGFETAALILDHPKTRHIPIIFVTAIAKDEVFQFRGYASGAVDYLTKPINPEILKSKISVFLQLWHKRHLLEVQNKQLLTLNHDLTETAQALAKAKKTAEDAARAKSNFLSTMSHEIRTPMNAVIGAIQLLKKTDMTSYQTDLLDTITYGGKTLMVIIDDILDLSKIEAGKIDLECIPFNFVDLLKRAIDTFRPLAADKALTLSLQMPHDHNDASHAAIFVEGDPTRITQIINNLVSNAIKFTEKGGVVLSCKILNDDKTPHDHSANYAPENSDPDGLGNAITVQITVEDSGIGMSKTQMEHLFSAFNQADSSTNRLFGGTGLGLSICKGLIDVMGGDIKAQSIVDQGSQFTITLTMPCVTPPNLKAPMSLSNTDAPQRTAHVLVVDDIETNLCIAQFLLEEQGHTVITANTGYEAIEIFNTQHKTLDIVLMDIQMPGMDGYDTVQEIRRIEASLNQTAIPIIALTADVLKETREKCLATGMNGFLNKPIEEAHLKELIQQHL